MAQRNAVLGLIVVAFAMPAAAQVYRCTDARGGITFQEQACPVTSDERVTTIPTSYPEVNLRERDRLLARADAAEARLLKRLEIEAAERIAREHRRAMEAAAQAQRERAQAAEAAVPVLVLAAPAARPFRPRHRPSRPVWMN